MSSYYTKLLELKGIENRDKKYYLRINFTSQETIEIFWKPMNLQPKT